MSTNRTYNASPNYHPDDKDIFDFLEASKPNKKDLQAFLRSSGIFPSPHATEEEISKLVSSIQLDWESCNALLNLEKLSEEHKNWSYSDQIGEVTDDAVEDSIKQIELLRSERNRETYRLEKNSEGYKLSILYNDIDYGKTRMIQSIEREAEIDFIMTPEGMRMRRTADRRTAEIEINILGKLQENLSVERKLETRVILLSRLPTSERRVKFFQDMMNGIEGFAFLDLTGVKVDRHDEDTDLSVTEGDESTARVQIERIKKVIFVGTGLGTTREYMDFINKNYFVSSATWEVVSNSSDGKCFELHARFRESFNEYRLEYKVRSVTVETEDGFSSKRRPTLIERMMMIQKLENAARSSFEIHSGA